MSVATRPNWGQRLCMLEFATCRFGFMGLSKELLVENNQSNLATSFSRCGDVMGTQASCLYKCGQIPRSRRIVFP